MTRLSSLFLICTILLAGCESYSINSIKSNSTCEDFTVPKFINGSILLYDNISPPCEEIFNLILQLNPGYQIVDNRKWESKGFIGDCYVNCHKGSISGENVNYFYFENLCVEKSVIDKNGEIGNPIEHKLTIILVPNSETRNEHLGINGQSVPNDFRTINSFRLVHESCR